MRAVRWFFPLFALLLACLPSSGSAQEEKGKSQEPKELNFAGTPYIYTGPDTGFGVGFAIMFRDLFKKEGRDATFSFDFTQTRYSTYSVDWQEPYFLSPRGRLGIGVSYNNRPSQRFFGLGNDSHRSDRCNWSWTKYDLNPRYIYRWPRTKLGVVGMRVFATVRWVDPDDGDLKDKSDELYYRKISEVFHDLYKSEQFDQTLLIGPGITFYLDARKDRFPLGGGREEVVWPLSGTYSLVSYQRFDEAIGSDFSFNRFTADFRQFIPLFSDDTILAVREKLVINQGNVPFYEQASFGSGSDLRGYYGFRFIGKASTQLQVELRQGFFPNQELAILGGRIKAKYPSVFLFWDEGRVYDEYEDIGEEWLENYHWTYGWGFRFVVTPTIVIRAEWGYSDEQVTFAVNAGLPF